MDLEPHLLKKQTSDLYRPLHNKKTNQSSSDNEDTYSLSSTSTSLIGLAIVLIMLGLPLLVVISERPETTKNLPILINQNGPE